MSFVIVIGSVRMVIESICVVGDIFEWSWVWCLVGKSRLRKMELLGYEHDATVTDASEYCCLSVTATTVCLAHELLIFSLWFSLTKLSRFLSVVRSVVYLRATDWFYIILWTKLPHKVLPYWIMLTTRQKGIENFFFYYSL